MFDAEISIKSNFDCIYKLNCIVRIISIARVTFVATKNQLKRITKKKQLFSFHTKHTARTLIANQQNIQKLTLSSLVFYGIHYVLLFSAWRDHDAAGLWFLLIFRACWPFSRCRQNGLKLMERKKYM